jgi:hypothetical protein
MKDVKLIIAARGCVKKYEFWANFMGKIRTILSIIFTFLKLNTHSTVTFLLYDYNAHLFFK